MKANSRNFTHWLGQPRDPQWEAMAKKNNERIMKKYAKAGTVSLEVVVALIVFGLFIGLLAWLIKTAFEIAALGGVSIGSHL